MNTFFFISSYLYRCSRHKLYLLRRLFLVGCISITFILLVSDQRLTTTELSRIGLDVFFIVFLLLYAFIILFVPIFAGKLLYDDMKQGVLPLLAMSKISTMSLLWYKYAAFLTLIAIHGSATLPIFLMCTHIGGIAAEQIIATYLLLFSYCALSCSMILFIGARIDFSMIKALFFQLVLVSINEICAYFFAIPISVLSQMDVLLGTGASSYLEFSFACWAISLSVLFYGRRKLTVFSINQHKHLEKMRKWLLSRYQVTKDFSRNNFIIQREERRQVFQITYAFCRIVYFIGLFGCIPFVNFFAMPMIAICGLSALTLYAASAFAIDEQEVELLMLTRIKPDVYLDNRRRAIWLAISPLFKLVHTYLIISAVCIVVVLIGNFLIPSVHKTQTRE